MAAVRWAAFALALTALTLPVGLATPAEASPPRGFFGVVSQAPLTPQDLDRMAGTVGTLRVAFDWAAIEPERDRFEWDATDEVVLGAARRGIGLLPVVGGRPSWAAAGSPRSPIDSTAERRDWRRFVAAVARRYGPGGELWRGPGPEAKPIRTWQIENEPNFGLYWPRPSPRGYARLLRIAAAVLRDRDRGARVVLAGLAPVNPGTPPPAFLRGLYRVPGIRSAFDSVALHPYSWTLAQLRYQVRRVRRVMAEAGDGRTPLLVSELGVSSSSVIPTSFDLGPRGQARFLRGAFELLLRERRRWRIAGVDWFSWRDVGYADAHCSFCQRSGLLDVAGKPKPSWHAYRAVALARVR